MGVMTWLAARRGRYRRIDQRCGDLTYPLYVYHGNFDCLGSFGHQRIQLCRHDDGDSRLPFWVVRIDVHGGFNRLGTGCVT